jgi:hypothetical protein
MKGKLYRSIDVWRRREADIVRYRCFHILPDEIYCVQSADFYRPPFDDKRVVELNKQFLQLLDEEAPESRSGGFPSLTEAIEAFDQEFGNQD